eukprot:TRINITY_DN3143_c4_g2_i1.p1 TRINITY_DN3143_c4_g2~~TRINITY_DN3143_c4_g2_i1.p1  ORF type:complete len:89 (-),score=11.57 TRINITY_DN3143_c4_g2_i1:146-412(-)
MHFLVKGLVKNTFAQAETLDLLKQEIAKQHGIAPTSQRLFSNGSVLSELEDNMIIELCAPLDGGKQKKRKKKLIKHPRNKLISIRKLN